MPCTVPKVCGSCLPSQTPLGRGLRSSGHRMTRALFFKPSNLPPASAHPTNTPWILQEHKCKHQGLEPLPNWSLPVGRVVQPGVDWCLVTAAFLSPSTTAETVATSSATRAPATSWPCPPTPSPCVCATAATPCSYRAAPPLAPRAGGSSGAPGSRGAKERVMLEHSRPGLRAVRNELAVETSPGWAASLVTGHGSATIVFTFQRITLLGSSCTSAVSHQLLAHWPVCLPCFRGERRAIPHPREHLSLTPQ